MSAVSVIIPALNEEEPIANVVHECLATKIPSEIIVADNGSNDRTGERAREAGAKVVSEPRHGYGRACLAGIRALSPGCYIVVFLDGDGSDCPEFVNQLVEPIAAGNFDFVIGSRARGRREPSSMNFQQIFAGWLAGWLMSILYGVRYTDMCPFRAIRRDALDRLAMKEETYGWNLEMQMKAARAGLRILEVRSITVDAPVASLKFLAHCAEPSSPERESLRHLRESRLRDEIDPPLRFTRAHDFVRSKAYEQIESSLCRIARGTHRRHRHDSRDVGPRLLWGRDAPCDHRRSAFGFY